jgi:enoyl-CoA hydratase/carnithine racemase
VSKKDAMAMLLTGDMINAEKAKEIGLINDIYSTDDVTNQTMRLAQKIATKSSLTIATGKNAFYAQAEMNLSNAYEYTSKVMTDNLMRDDAKEGINAFIEKRDPDWQDN